MARTSTTFPSGVANGKGSSQTRCDLHIPVTRVRKVCAVGHHNKSPCTQEQAGAASDQTIHAITTARLAAAATLVMYARDLQVVLVSEESGS